MTLGKVLSSVVSTEKHKSLHSKKIFVIQPLSENLKPVTGSGGNTFLAIDEVQAGEGDIVIVCREGNGCRQIMNDDQAPVNALIVGIVDALD